MKVSLFRVSFFAVLAFLLVGCSSRQSVDAVNYNNKIVQMQSQVVESIISFTSSLPGRDKKVLDEKNEQLRTVLDEKIKELNELQAFPEDQGLKAVAMEFFLHYKSLADNEYKTMMEFYLKPKLTDEEIEKAKALAQDMTKKEEELDTKFMLVQQAFAKKYNVPLVENTLSK